jgi:Predicted Zn-dependent hydrolases of the beta-lactamase fold
MYVRWHGHSCFELRGSANRVVIDPHDGNSIGINPPIVTADIVLVSHDHYDHNAIKTVKGNFSCIFAKTGVNEVKGLTVEGFPSFHDEEKGALRGLNVIYKFKVDGVTVCHCGDLGDIPSDEVVESLKNVDIMLVPTGETYTLPIPKLEIFLKRVNPKIIVPMHYRVGTLSLPISPLGDFLKIVSDDTVLHVGNEVELSPNEISEFMGVWVFDR